MALGYLNPYRRGSLRGSSGGGSLFDLHRQMNRLFDDMFDQDGDSGFYNRAGMAAPAMDIHQNDDELEITAELPGVKEEDIDITIDDGILTIRGEKKSSREEDEGGYRERTYGSFERRLTLPPNIDDDNCSADFKDGVLTIRLPKSEEKTRGRRIPLGRARSRDARAEDALIEQKGEEEARKERHNA